MCFEVATGAALLGTASGWSLGSCFRSETIACCIAQVGSMTHHYGAVTTETENMFCGFLLFCVVVWIYFLVGVYVGSCVVLWL